MLKLKEGRTVENTGNKFKVKPSQQAADLSAVFAKAAPTNKDVLTVLKAIWERG